MWVTVVMGLLLFNWWIALPAFVPASGMFDRLISDATATGAPNADLLRWIEAIGAVLLLVALFVRGPLDGNSRVRRDWWCVVGLVVFEMVGAVFVEACESGTDRECFDRELALELPWHHYLHIVAGVAEWSLAVLAALYGWRRLRGTARGRVYAAMLVYGAVILVPLAVTFVTHRLFSAVEFTIYAAFSTIIVLVVSERGHWPERD